MEQACLTAPVVFGESPTLCSALKRKVSIYKSSSMLKQYLNQTPHQFGKKKPTAIKTATKVTAEVTTEVTTTKKLTRINSSNPFKFANFNHATSFHFC